MEICLSVGISVSRICLPTGEWPRNYITFYKATARLPTKFDNNSVRSTLIGVTSPDYCRNLTQGCPFLLTERPTSCDTDHLPIIFWRNSEADKHPYPPPVYCNQCQGQITMQTAKLKHQNMSGTVTLDVDQVSLEVPKNCGSSLFFNIHTCAKKQNKQKLTKAV